jgi:hypothetical protein
MAFEPVTIASRVIRPHKAVHDAQFERRTVLTNDPFNYVDLWLRRQRHDDAIFYWRQARAFYHAARGLPIEASPLVLYYCFMNAAKALLAAKRVPFAEQHGVRSHKMRKPGKKIVLSNEGVKILNKGVVPALGHYLTESQTSTHSLEDVLYNIVCIHRTYCLSYPRRKEIFLPIREAAFVRNTDNGEVRLRARAASDVDWIRFRKVLPPRFQPLTGKTNDVVSSSYVSWATTSSPSPEELAALRGLHEGLRADLHYINGAQTLWYIKVNSNYGIDRRPMTLMLAAMHRLSEICRYRPSDLLSLLNGRKNWLLAEFISMTPPQFMDEIACEITGHQIMIPNVRTPT